jgi:predicted transcriptional regulator
MTTTTIRIDDDLKRRVADAAERAGKTSHAFIMDAIRDTVEQAERQADFHRVADERWARVARTGATVPLEEAEAYLDALARGERPPRPVARRNAALVQALAGDKGSSRAAGTVRKSTRKASR